jgi:hypothetical protein
MTKHVNADSILSGNFCDIVKYFRAADIDDVDRLAQRALTIILKTDRLVQTGEEVDTDPFTANMLASSALKSINCTLKTYPFLKAPEEEPAADEDAVFASALDLVEMAEKLMSRSQMRSTILADSGLRPLLNVLAMSWMQPQEPTISRALLMPSGAFANWHGDGHGHGADLHSHGDVGCACGHGPSDPEIIAHELSHGVFDPRDPRGSGGLTPGDVYEQLGMRFRITAALLDRLPAEFTAADMEAPQLSCSERNTD